MSKASIFDKVGKIKMSQRIMILVGTLVLLAGGYLSLVYLPKTATISRTDQDISDLRRRIAVAKRKARDLKKFQAEERDVNAQFKEALKLLPNKKEIPTLLRSITELGKDSKLEFPLFSPQGERAQDFYTEIPVNIVLSGRYNDIASFFDKVGHMDRIVNILDISMRPKEELSTTLIAKCTAVTYRFKAKKDGKKPRKKKK